MPSRSYDVFCRVMWVTKGLWFLIGQAGMTDRFSGFLAKFMTKSQN